MKAQHSYVKILINILGHMFLSSFNVHIQITKYAHIENIMKKFEQNQG